MNAYAVIMAGGGGERLWPVSTPELPKQFVDVFGGKPLIRHALDRLHGLIPPERTLVVTGARLVALTRRALPETVAFSSQWTISVSAGTWIWTSIRSTAAMSFLTGKPGIAIFTANSLSW